MEVIMENNNQRQSSKLIPTCPVCGRSLMFLMPDGIVLHCNNCNKYFQNDNGKAGKERKAPVYKKGVLY